MIREDDEDWPSDDSDVKLEVKQETFEKQGDMFVRKNLEMDFCRSLLNRLHTEQYLSITKEFQHPVDESICTDYGKFVERRMDLSFMRSKIDKDRYVDARGFEKDFRLMLHNCFVYNPLHEPVYACGLELEKVFNKMWAEIPNFQLAEGSAQPNSSGGNEPVMIDLEELDLNDRPKNEAVPVRKLKESPAISEQKLEARPPRQLAAERVLARFTSSRSSKGSKTAAKVLDTPLSPNDGMFGSLEALSTALPTTTVKLESDIGPQQSKDVPRQPTASLPSSIDNINVSQPEMTSNNGLPSRGGPQAPS